MNRDEFMRQVEYLLSDIPEEDKCDAIAYYRDYLEEAGDDAEAAIREFGSPERIAAIIRSDIQGDLEDGGAFTERGYEDERFRDPSFQMVKRQDLPDVRETAGGEEAHAQDSSGKRRSRDRRGEDRRSQNSDMPKGWKLVFLILLLVAAAPVLLGIGGGIIGLISGAAGILLAVVLCMALLTFALLVAGLCVIAFGAVYLAADLGAGLLCMGIGLMVLAFGLLCLLASVWFYGKCLPWLVRGTANLFGRIFHRKGGAA